MLTTLIGKFRLTGIVEGTSYLLLLGVAMPLKYIWHMPIYVKVVGMTHGILFILYCLLLLARSHSPAGRCSGPQNDKIP